MERLNGKVYPLWEQFIERKAEWIGGVLQDRGDSLDHQIGVSDRGWVSTEITDIQLKPNGSDSAFFEVIGKDFACGSDVQHLAVGVLGEWDGITLIGYGGHMWRIKTP